MPDYFTLVELRALPDLSDTSLYPDARCEAVAAYVVETIERVVGTSFIARSVTEIHDGGDGTRLGIATRRGWVQAVSSASESGAELTPVPVDKDGSGVLFKFATGSNYPTPWQAGQQNVSITYTSGYSSTAPADVKEAALQATRNRLIATNGRAGQSARRTRLTTEAGVFDLAVPGENAPFGMPEVDTVIVGWRDRIDALGFA